MLPHRYRLCTSARLGVWLPPKPHKPHSCGRATGSQDLRYAPSSPGSSSSSCSADSGHWTGGAPPRPETLGWSSHIPAGSPAQKRRRKEAREESDSLYPSIVVKSAEVPIIRSCKAHASTAEGKRGLSVLRPRRALSTQAKMREAFSVLMAETALKAAKLLQFT